MATERRKEKNKQKNTSDVKEDFMSFCKLCSLSKGGGTWCLIKWERYQECLIIYLFFEIDFFGICENTNNDNKPGELFYLATTTLKFDFELTWKYVLQIDSFEIIYWCVSYGLLAKIKRIPPTVISNNIKLWKVWIKLYIINVTDSDNWYVFDLTVL